MIKIKNVLELIEYCKFSQPYENVEVFIEGIIEFDFESLFKFVRQIDNYSINPFDDLYFEIWGGEFVYSIGCCSYYSTKTYEIYECWNNLRDQVEKLEIMIDDKVYDYNQKTFWELKAFL